MKTTKIKASVMGAVLMLGSSAAALADHNSLWGDGTALDPMDVHDTRFDTLTEDLSGPFDASTLIEPGAVEPTMSMPSTIDAGGSTR